MLVDAGAVVHASANVFICELGEYGYAILKDGNAFQIGKEVANDIVVVESEASRGVERIRRVRNGYVVDNFSSKGVDTSIGNLFVSVVAGSRVKEEVSLVVTEVVGALSITNDAGEIVLSKLVGSVVVKLLAVVVRSSDTDTLHGYGLLIVMIRDRFVDGGLGWWKRLSRGDLVKFHCAGGFSRVRNDANIDSWRVRVERDLR